MAVIKTGRSAITHFKVLKADEKYSLLECNLETGRTHQIRVHMTSIGHPIVGDKTYGKKNDKENKMMLHSYKLIFKHPSLKKQIKLETLMPERFKEILTADN
jgi:23S rRNA pseudouridine1911/1915/1917 synthase